VPAPAHGVIIITLRVVPVYPADKVRFKRRAPACVLGPVSHRPELPDHDAITRGNGNRYVCVPQGYFCGLVCPAFIIVYVGFVHYAVAAARIRERVRGNPCHVPRPGNPACHYYIVCAHGIPDCVNQRLVAGSMKSGARVSAVPPQCP